MNFLLVHELYLHDYFDYLLRVLPHIHFVVQNTWEKNKTMRMCNQMSLYLNIPRNKRKIHFKLNTIVHICGTVSIKLK